MWFFQLFAKNLWGLDGINNNCCGWVRFCKDEGGLKEGVVIFGEVWKGKCAEQIGYKEVSLEDFWLYGGGVEPEAVTSKAFGFFSFGARIIPNTGAVDGISGFGSEVNGGWINCNIWNNNLNTNSHIISWYFKDSNRCTQRSRCYNCLRQPLTFSISRRPSRSWCSGLLWGSFGSILLGGFSHLLCRWSKQISSREWLWNSRVVDKTIFNF